MSTQRSQHGNSPLKPSRLKAGDTIGLINPASGISGPENIRTIEEQLAILGLKVKQGVHLLDRYGYLAGKDEDRAADMNAMFADSSVKAILAMRGGWGSNRILSLLDYDLIRKNPKAVIGYSDITALLIALYAKSGIVTFHGPLGVSTWGPLTVSSIQRILFNCEAATLQNSADISDDLTQTENRIEIITAGRTSGRLIGGNLAVLTSMIGSNYLPDWKGKILFLEDTNEQIYRVDRMLTQLKLAGILDQIRGFIFGRCTDCGPEESSGSLTLADLFADHIKPLGIPAWYGSMIGHVPDQLVLPIGIEVEINADKGTILMLEQAVI